MPFAKFKKRSGHSNAFDADAEMDRQPSTVNIDNPTTPLVQTSPQDEQIVTMPEKPSLQQRWTRLWRHRIDLYHPEPRKKVTYRLVVFVPLLSLTGFMLYILYLAAIASILRSLQPPTPQNGLQMIIDAWRGAESADARLLDIDSYTFSSSVTPKPCHSHNDYMHRVPLFEALAAGCVSVEADIYLPLDNASKNTSELLVSHKRSALSSLRTLRSLYTEPLLTVLKAMNPSVANDTDLNGPFLSDSSTYLTLLLDFKELSPDALAQSLALLQSHLTPLRNAGFLTTYNNVTISIDQRPLTIVASGALPLDMIMDPTLNPHDDVFLDAPLNDLFPNGRDTDSPYNISNSAMASASLSTAIGNPGVLSGAFSESQKNKMGEQVAQAAQLGLKSRYWGTPAWPAGSMGYVWRELLQRGISVLNVDELGLFARWRWDEGKLSKWCWLLGSVVGGVCR